MSKKSRKRKLEGEDQSMIDWEQESLLPDDLKDEMESMWEIPQVFHFLHLTKEALNVPHLTMYEMERMLLMPRASRQLANIMTCLLSSAMTKAKLRKIPPMPYEFWTNILTHKLKGWFKVYDGKHRDAVKVLETIGVEPEFWKVFSDATLAEGKDFEELSFRQKVWLLKTVCDTIMHTRKTVQEEMAKQPWEDQFETTLGTDRYGARYIYFPQFLKTDLRVYRHCLDNKVLASAKAKTKAETVQKRKSRWNGATIRNRSRTKKSMDYPGDCGCNSDSAVNSTTNEDDSARSASSCDNNNHINLEALERKRRTRSLSKASQDSTTSTETRCSNTRSSGYDTSTSNDKPRTRDPPTKMFRGFTSAGDDKCNIEIINGILDGLKSQIDDVADEDESTLDNPEATRDSERSVDNLSSGSKTDDEKLNEIIGAESSRLFLPEETHRIAASKSDDEKLNETRSVVGGQMKDSENREADSSVKPEELEEEARHEAGEEVVSSCRNMESVESRKSTRRSLRVRSRRRSALSTTVAKSKEEKGRSLMENCDSNEEVEAKYNLRRAKSEDGAKGEKFDHLLAELGVSKFKLVADSVETLRELVSSFSSNEAMEEERRQEEPLPSCEEKLVQRLTELLSSLEETETILKDATKKARAKLQKEWSNFKEGLEDQDSSGEGGLSSNWWVLGSQGCPLPAPGEATLQTLSQPALSPFGDRQEVASEEPERTKRQQQGEAAEDDCERDRSQNEEEAEPPGDDTEESKEQEAEQESRRVLRARGVSSYTEQLYSDDEGDENELEEWTDVEAVYAAASAQASASTPHPPAKARQPDDGSQEEDSDQDWILPSSRKRKNKRPSASRRLKSFQHKLQGIKVDAQQEKPDSTVASPMDSGTSNDECKTKEATETIEASESKQDPTSGTICKIESVVSVHSELDIKDEGPIFDPAPTNYENPYPPAPQQGYVMVKTDHNPVNYYVMQPDMMQHAPLMQSHPMMQQGYYLQNAPAPSYMLPHQSYVSPRQAGYQQGPQMIAPQQFLGQPPHHPGYVPYMVSPPQENYLAVQVPRVQETSRPVQVTRPSRGQTRAAIPRQNYAHANGAVIRSSMPIRSQSTRAPRGRPAQQQRPVNPGRCQRQEKPNPSSQKTTSLIVLSDSDDEIEMIVTEKPEGAAGSSRKPDQPRQKPKVTSEVTVSTSKGTIPPQIIQRMSQGGISITPVKPAAPAQNSGTQLVVVVNETGSHYALALPNGSKLILTPEQVAQIRASNGGKLILSEKAFESERVPSAKCVEKNSSTVSTLRMCMVTLKPSTRGEILEELLEVPSGTVDDVDGKPSAILQHTSSSEFKDRPLARNDPRGSFLRLESSLITFPAWFCGKDQ
ncbi:hypothetical protein KM043_001177 [Ampulex compressa]|nr:hypothetical protein KM043_001177 [Ampulex compressa]